MTQYWHRLATRIDALTLRERAIVFALAALVLITVINATMLDPLFARNKLYSGQIRDSQAKIADIQNKIQLGARAQAMDPDQEIKQRLKKLEQQSKQMQTALQEVQKGLVSPDKMPSLLESILRRHGNLRLISLKTLPPADLVPAGDTNTNSAADKTATTNKETNLPSPKVNPVDAKPGGYVYKHGVEITVQGSYLDMVSYMSELEAMPWQVFWGKAVLNSDEYSKATLTLTLYTLSLDKQWLNI